MLSRRTSGPCPAGLRRLGLSIRWIACGAGVALLVAGLAGCASTSSLRAGKAAVKDIGAAKVFKNGVNGKGVAPDKFGGKGVDDGDGLYAAMNTFAKPRNTGVGFNLEILVSHFEYSEA